MYGVDRAGVLPRVIERFRCIPRVKCTYPDDYHLRGSQRLHERKADALLRFAKTI